MKLLKVGDIRQRDDQYRQDLGDINYWDCQPRKSRWTEWMPVEFIGQPLLPGDLIHKEYRRVN